MELSVVVPVYNEEKRLRKTLSRLGNYLKHHTVSYEILVIDDGSTDRSGEIVREMGQGLNVRLIRHNSNHGKGYAVRKGVLESRGKLIFFTDADLSTPPQEVTRFVKIFNKSQADILIGSRSVPGSELKIKQPCYRQSMGRVFNWFVKLLTPLRFMDTQCGFKGFRREAALEIFSRAKEKGFAFDVEILLLAKKLGYGIEEIPVTWVNNRTSKVGALKDSSRMFLELLRIRKIAKKR